MVVEGTPETVAACERSHTGVALRQALRPERTSPSPSKVDLKPMPSAATALGHVHACRALENVSDLATGTGQFRAGRHPRWCLARCSWLPGEHD